MSFFSWCQIVRFIMLVPNCPGAKLSVFIMLVPNCPGAKLSGAKLSYHLFQVSQNSYFIAKYRLNGRGWLHARPVHLERAWYVISHPNGWENRLGTIFASSSFHFSRCPKMAILWLNPDLMEGGGCRLDWSTWKGPGVLYHIQMDGEVWLRIIFACSSHLSRIPGVQKWLFYG